MGHFGLLLQKDVLLGELLFIAIFKALTLAVAFGGVFYLELPELNEDDMPVV